MKRDPFEPTAEVALMASSARESILSPQTRPLQALFDRLPIDQLAEAARQDDRAEFDRLFDRCFERVYAIAWHATGDQARSESLTTRILCEAVASSIPGAGLARAAP